MGFLSPSIPNPPPLPPAAAPTTLANASLSGTAQNSRAKTAGAMGMGTDGTMSGTPLGAGTPATAKGSLLGS